MENQTVNEGKTTAIISYITIIGTVAALIMNSSKKNSFASFHIRQMIGLVGLGLVNQYVITKFLGGTIGMVIAVILFVLWVIGFIGAVKGEEKRIPLLGDQFQEWFKSI
ncbi:hypothetical protein [uncultured Polaribacter sp.]|uniref:DUF4870 domain-containing protein n=1 Tax=uncultured Polaribacter sp. TaxID=174711 RepID=UPI00262B6C9D|nr:hypothetical protein [uncultured Polaribacter sp.]